MSITRHDPERGGGADSGRQSRPVQDTSGLSWHRNPDGIAAEKVKFFMNIPPAKRSKIPLLINCRASFRR